MVRSRMLRLLDEPRDEPVTHLCDAEAARILEQASVSASRAVDEARAESRQEWDALQELWRRDASWITQIEIDRFLKSADPRIRAAADLLPRVRRSTSSMFLPRPRSLTT